MRAFDPRAVGGLECRAWETHYRRRWLAFLLASARSFMRRFYRLLRVSEGATFDTTRAAQLEVEWWRAHRERQHDDSHLEHADELVGALVDVYAYTYGVRGPRTASGRGTSG